MPQLMDIPIGELKPREENLREVVDGSDLVASIEVYGVMEPLLVTKNGEGYWIDAGHRRYDGAVKAGLDAVPCIVYDPAEGGEVSPNDVTFTMLIENLMREDLNPVEEAKGYERLVEGGIKQADIAKSVGVAPSQVSRRLSLLKLPEAIQNAVAQGKLELRIADKLTKLVDYPEILAALLARQHPSEYDINRAIDQAEKNKAKAKAEKILADAGATVVDHKAIYHVIEDDPTKTWTSIEVEGTDEDGDPYTDDEVIDLTNQVEVAAAVARKDVDGIQIFEQMNYNTGKVELSGVLMKKIPAPEHMLKSAEAAKEEDPTKKAELEKAAAEKREKDEKLKRDRQRAEAKHETAFWSAFVQGKHTAADVVSALITVIYGRSTDSNKVTAGNLLGMAGLEETKKTRGADGKEKTKTVRNVGAEFVAEWEKAAPTRRNQLVMALLVAICKDGTMYGSPLLDELKDKQGFKPLPKGVTTYDPKNPPADVTKTPAKAAAKKAPAKKAATTAKR